LFWLMSYMRSFIWNSETYNSRGKKWGCI
jgi:hypothetical protein